MDRFTDEWTGLLSGLVQSSINSDTLVDRSIHKWTSLAINISYSWPELIPKYLNLSVIILHYISYISYILYNSNAIAVVKLAAISRVALLGLANTISIIPGLIRSNPGSFNTILGV